MSWRDASCGPLTPAPALRDPSSSTSSPNLISPSTPFHPSVPLCRPVASPGASTQDQLESTLTILADFYADWAFQAKAETEYWKRANERLAGIQGDLSQVRMEAMEWKDELVTLVERKVGEWTKRTLQPTIVSRVLSGRVTMPAARPSSHSSGEGSMTLTHAVTITGNEVIGSERSVDPVWTLPPLLESVDWSFMDLTERDCVESAGTSSKPAPVRPARIAAAGSQLSSGVESLPSGSSTSVAGSGNRMRHRSTGRDLRQLVGNPDYVRHPIDRFKLQQGRLSGSVTGRRHSPASSRQSDRSASVSTSQTRGWSAVPAQDLLPHSDGIKRSGARWPPKGLNTMRGRMKEIMCDVCKGRVHWACSGLGERDEVCDQPWSCPDCEEHMTREESPFLEVAQSQQERCIRSDCMLRSRQAVIRKKDDDDTFYMSRIIGRRVIRRKVSDWSRIYEYLVQWEGWPVFDCTWEPSRNLQDLAYYEEHFVAECKKTHVDIKRKVVLLPEAHEWFDDKGDRKIDKMRTEGVEFKMWHF